MNAVDTNILIYVHDRRNVRKQVIAESLVRTLPQGVLLWQVACEYISAFDQISQGIRRGHTQRSPHFTKFTGIGAATITKMTKG